MANNRINPKTGKRVAWEQEQAAKTADVDAQRELEQQIRLLERQKAIMVARDRFMPFIKFTSPDPEDPNDVNKSRYKNARHHDALARVVEEVVNGGIKFLILTMPPRHGKECADSTPVLTPDGWTTHGKLRAGDRVFGPDGKPTEVLRVSTPNYSKMRVTLTNGDSISCHPNHEWVVYDRSRGRWMSRSTEYLASRTLRVGPKGRGGRYVFQLPDTPAVEFGEKRLPLSPYALGVWLGDGTTHTGVITMDKDDAAVWRRVRDVLGGCEMSEAAHPNTGVIAVRFGNGKPGAHGPLARRLSDAGVLHDKHIPEVYLRSSKQQRLELLAGLMDTDGHVEAKSGRCRIVTINEALRDGIVDLCTTLGFRPYVTSQEAAESSGGIKGRHRVYTIGFQPSEDIPVMTERRKIKRFAVRRRVAIKSIEPATEEPGRCIQVARSDGLYLVGRSLTPTHNSEQVSRRLPAWFMGRFPDKNGIVATYNDDFASDFGKDVRSIVTSPQFKQVFPDCRLVRGGGAADRLQTTRGGQWSFVGRGGSLTGRGGHILICDDLIKDDKEAQSQAIRDQAWNWFTKVAMSRRMGQKLVIMTFTRWHSDDPIGRLTDPENEYYNHKLAQKIKIINFPAIAEDDDPLGRKPGEPLWPDGPDKFDLDFLAEQQALDPLGFAALYQQRPSVMDGTLFRRESVQYYRQDQLPDTMHFYCSSDHAVGTNQRNDPSVLLKIGVDAQSNIYLLDCIWKKMPADEAVEAMLTMASDNMKPLLWWAERGHISKSIGPFLRKRMVETGKFINIVEVTPVADKATRAQAIAARFAMGKVLFPKDAWWTEKAINQLLAFPNATHDDFVDALAYIGLGLQSQFAAPGPREADKVPKFGTLGWVKYMENWKSQQRQRSASGGF